MKRLLTALAVVALLVLVSAVPAFAHDMSVTFTPNENAGAVCFEVPHLQADPGSGIKTAKAVNGLAWVTVHGGSCP